MLERRGLIERDIENAWLATDFEAGPLDDLIGHSTTYRITVGSREGQKLFTLQTVPPRLQGQEGDATGAARTGDVVCTSQTPRYELIAPPGYGAWTNQPKTSYSSMP